MESYLLTDEFRKFSESINKLYDEKKKKEAAMRQQYEQYLLDMDKLDAKAAQEEAKFEEWRKSHSEKGESESRVDALFKSE